uniref:Uncharacterized protein n=1 Tax=Oryza rufipogon TaxID=4529 RepID=A0A0E0NR61_ORYRU
MPDDGGCRLGVRDATGGGRPDWRDEARPVVEERGWAMTVIWRMQVTTAVWRTQETVVVVQDKGGCVVEAEGNGACAADAKTTERVVANWGRQSYWIN